ncbi:hypothetical protein B9Z55_028524 [Caenorhabditis nigoni]|uniref:Uncharacterized protein n=1 Tax=Caenorhabditis nigoni TaxID=1611254 RepID=A0A2G5SBL1_9PELO|nr:hypothetical protein B9Z55_028524 [Caenorhabditis nigoni]
MNSDCDYNIKSSSRYIQSESCTKLNYVYTSRQCDEYFEYLEELRRIIFGPNNTMSSAKTLPTHPSSIHYHTRTGRTLVYEIGDSTNYGITLSQLPSNTEKMVTETFCAEEHVLASPETSEIIPPKLTPKLFHQLPSNIEERMKNCLHSSSEVINSYLSDSIEQLEKFTMSCDDTAVVQSSSYGMPVSPIRQYHNSYNFSDDEFDDTLSLNFGVDDSFAVSEEFAKVLEETDSVFEELGGDEEFEDRWSISDDKVKRIVGIVKRHVPPSEVIVNHPPIVEYAPDPGPKSYDWLENDSFNFQLPSILNHRSEPLENQQPSSISYDHSPSVQDVPISPNSNRKTSRSSTPSQSPIPVQDISTSPASSRKTSGSSTPPAGSVLVNMIEDYVKMVMDVSKSLGKSSEAPEVLSEVVSGVLPVLNEIEKQRETETRESLETEIGFEEDKEQRLEVESEEVEIEDQKVMFGPIAPRKSSVKNWESATLKRERPPSSEETAISEKQGHLELSDISSQNVFHTEPLTLEDIIRIRRSLSESNASSDTRKEVAELLDTNDDFPDTQVPKNKDNSDVDSLNSNNLTHVSFSHIGSVSDNGISESGISSNSPNVENRKEEESQFFRVSQEKECVYPDASPEAQIDGEVTSRNCNNPQEDSQPHRSINIEKEESDSISNKSFHSSPVSCELERIRPMLDEEFETSCDEFTKTDKIPEEHFLGTEEEIQKLVENLLAHVKEEINNNGPESVLGEDLGEEENFSDVEADSDITEVLENLLSTVSQTEQRNEAVECILELGENFRNDADVEDVEESDNSEEANELEDAPELDFGSEYNVEDSAGRDEDQSELVQQERVIESVLNCIVNQLENEETLEEEAHDTVDPQNFPKTSEPEISVRTDEEPTFKPELAPKTQMDAIHESDQNHIDNFVAPSLHRNNRESSQEMKDIIKYMDNLQPNQPNPADTKKINVQTLSTESVCSETEEEIANEHESKLSDTETENVQSFDDISTEMDAVKVLDYLLDSVAQTSNTLIQDEADEINLEDQAEHTPEEQAGDSLSDASRDPLPSTSASTKSPEEVDVETDSQNEQVVVSDHFADELADELADQSADQLADELAERFADELADELADQLADELADQLADQLANELGDDDAVCLDIEEIVESEAELEIYERSSEQENEEDVLDVLQSVLNEVLYDPNDFGNACFSPDILDEVQSTSSSPNSLATELSTEAWEALQSVLDNLDVIIHSAEIRQIDEAVDFVQEPVENIEIEAGAVEHDAHGFEEAAELDILDYDDQASTDLNDDLVQQGEVQEALNDIICIIDVVESLLFEVSNSMDSEQFSLEAETVSELELGTVEVTHLGFETLSNQVRKSVDVQDYGNEHHTVEEGLQEEHRSILVSADNEDLNKEIVETVGILLNAVVEEENTQDLGLSHETVSNQNEDYEDFSNCENSVKEETPEQHHGVLVNSENEEDAGAEEEIVTSCVSSALQVVEVMEILLSGMLEEEGGVTAAADMDGEGNLLEENEDVEVSGDRYEGNSQGPTDNQHHEFSNNTLTDESRDLLENERHKKELQKKNGDVLVCAQLEEIADTEEETGETVGIMLNDIVEAEAEGTAADLDGEDALLEQIENVEVTENGLKENGNECELQDVELPVSSNNEKTSVEGYSNEAMSDNFEKSVDLHENEHLAVEEEVQKKQHDALVCAENEEVVDEENETVLGCVSSAVEVVESTEVLLNGIVEEEVVSAANTDGADVKEPKDGCRANEGDCEQQEPPILEVNQRYAEGCSHEILSNQDDHQGFENEHHDFGQVLQEPNHGVLVSNENEEVACEEEEIAEKVEILLNGVVEEEDRVTEADMSNESTLLKHNHMSEDVEERSEVPEEVNGQQPPTALSDSIEELSSTQIKSETNRSALNSTNSATDVLLHFEDFCASYLENLISDQLLSAMASASTMLTSQLERQLEAEDIYSISPAVPSPLSDSYSTFPCVLKSSLNSLEPILEVEEIYSTPPGDLTDPRDAILEDETSQGRLSRLEEDIMCDQPRSPNHLFGSNQTKETSDKTVDDNQSFEIMDPDPQHLSEPSANINNQSASTSHLVSDIPSISRSLVPESSIGDDNPEGHFNLPSSCQQLQIEKARSTPWGLLPESSDCSLCTDIYDPVPTNTNFSTETSPNSLNPSEHQSTSSVLEEVSHFLATACVAALVFVSPTESSDSTFNSDIIEDASKYINDSNPEQTSQ